MTDRTRLCPDGTVASQCECLVDQVREAVAAGIDLVQIREPDLAASALAELVAAAVGLAQARPTRIMVNDRLDVALAVGAHGVHLRADSVAASAVRAIAPAGFWIGRSVHAPVDVRAAGTVDYLLAGTVFETRSKPMLRVDERLGIDGLAGIVRESACPVLAIGGVTVDALPQVAATGAVGVAAIGLFMSPSEASGRRCRAMPLANLVKVARQVFDTSSRAF